MSLPSDLADAIDVWVEEEQTNRSLLLTKVLREEQRRRFEVDLEEQYREVAADGFYDDIECYFPAQAEVILAEPS